MRLHWLWKWLLVLLAIAYGWLHYRLYAYFFL